MAEQRRGTSPGPWRVGRKVGRTIYDADNRLIGVMDTVDDAVRVVEAVNADIRCPYCGNDDCDDWGDPLAHGANFDTM